MNVPFVTFKIHLLQSYNFGYSRPHQKILFLDYPINSSMQLSPKLKLRSKGRLRSNIGTSFRLPFG